MGNFDKLDSPFRAGGKRYLSRKMIHGFHAAEILLDRKRNSLYIAQGSWNVGYKPSAGTHDKSGVADVYDDDLDGLVKALRKLGFFGYHRTKAQGFDPHVHTGTNGDPGMGSYAMLQEDAYYDDRNGLGANARAGVDNEWAPRDRRVTLNIGAWHGDWVATGRIGGYSQATKDQDLKKVVRDKGYVIKNQIATVDCGKRRFVVTDNGTFYERSKLKFQGEKRKSRIA